MRFVTRLLWSVSSLFLATPVAPATVWTVGPGGDFSQISTALAAATDGDVVQVEPGTYLPFTLSKGVVVRAVGDPFVVNLDTSVRDLEAGRRAAISGMRLVGEDVRLFVFDCAGEVILENISIEADSFPGSHNNLRLSIFNSANVVVEYLDASTGNSFRTLIGNQPTVKIRASQVRMNHVVVEGAPGSDYQSDVCLCHGGDAGDGIWAIAGSLLVLSQPLVSGGEGGAAGCSIDWDGYGPCGNGGAGGHALRVVDSHVFVSGRPTDRLRGGNGGRALSSYDDCGNGGDGGAGILVSGSGSAAYSRINASGGFGGLGGGVPCSRGTRGPATSGAVTVEDDVPLLTWSPHLTLGGPSTIALRAWRPAIALLMVADGAGFSSFLTFGGPPLGVIEDRFRVTLAFPTDLAGNLTLVGNLPADPSLLGLPLGIQCAVVDPSGPNQLSNAVTRVIGD